MAYLTPDSTGRRIAVLGAVGAVHGVMAAALLTGFAGGIIKELKRQALPAWTYMPPPPPTAPAPDVKPPAHPHHTMSLPDPFVPLSPMPDPGLPVDTLPPFGPGPSGDLLPPLPPSPPGSGTSFTPRGAQPLGAPGNWVSEADYPAAALRRGDQGATRFDLVISPDGHVRECRIAQSSGSADLDAATCARLTQRARFTPARDEHGDPVAGRYGGVIRWRIPE